VGRIGGDFPAGCLKRHGFGAELDDIQKAIKEKKAKWEAGETSVNKLSYSERKLRASANVPHLKDTDTFVGPESPMGGISPSLDWRNYNGLSYVTRSKTKAIAAVAGPFPPPRPGVLLPEAGEPAE